MTFQRIAPVEQPTLAMQADAMYDPRDTWTDEQWDEADRFEIAEAGKRETLWDGWPDEQDDQPPF